MTDDETVAPYNRRIAVLRRVAVFGFVLALALLSSPTPLSVAAGALLLIAGEAVRLWAAGHLRKSVELVTVGPYRHVRHPLYLGRLLILTGLCVACRFEAGSPYLWNAILLAVSLGVFFGYYLPRKERVESARLRRLHGEAFERYRRSVPAILPQVRNIHEHSANHVQKGLIEPLDENFKNWPRANNLSRAPWHP